MILKPTCFGLLAGSALLAASVAHANDTTATPAIQAAPTENGVRAYIDPATGKLRQPTAAERAEEARLAADAAKLRKGKGVKIDRQANGAKRGLDLEGRLMESVVVTRAADGALQYHYVTGDASQVDPANLPQAEEK
jgi:hypothetical protein